MGKEDLDVETDYVKRKINGLLLAIDDARQLEEYEKLVLLRLTISGVIAGSVFCVNPFAGAVFATLAFREACCLHEIDKLKKKGGLVGELEMNLTVLGPFGEDPPIRLKPKSLDIVDIDEAEAEEKNARQER